MIMHRLNMEYNVAEYSLNTSEKDLANYVNEAYKVCDNTGKKQKVNYDNVLNTPSISSLKLWEQTSIFDSLLQKILVFGKYYTGNHALTIVNAWAVIYKPNDYSILHDHSPSRLSFVYYLNVDKTAPLEFPASSMISSNKVAEVTPCPDSLLLFPSFAEHRVAPNMNNKDRIVIAGNFSR